MPCDADEVGVPVAGEFFASVSGLRYDPLVDQYSCACKTDRTWSGTCRELTFGLVDGAPRTLAFSFG